MPIRIQRRRVKGWKMPADTIYVGRGSAWGNPNKIGVSLYPNGDGTFRRMTAADAVDRYRADLPFWLSEDAGHLRRDLKELRGKNLACWCALDQPCHADVLLELANKPVCEEV